MSAPATRKDETTLAARPTSLSATTVSSPLEALHREEYERTRQFLLLIGVCVVMVISTAGLLGGDPVAKRALLVATVVCGVVALWMGLAIRDPRRFTSGKVAFLGICCALTSFVSAVYWGFNSAATTLVVLGMFFHGRSFSKKAGLAIYATGAGAQAVWAVVVLSGVAHDPGIFVMGVGHAIDSVLSQVMIQVVFFLGYWMARSSRDATLRVMGQLQAATMEVRQRDALLHEVRQDLDRALGPGVGRYTDATLGPFRMGRVLGRGGMGEVYEATRGEGGEEVAVKVLLSHLSHDAEHVERFLREARATAAIESPHIVKVLETAGSDAAVPYIAMERLRGRTLGQILRDEQRLPAKEVAGLVRQVARVIDAARPLSLVHRDLKPHNLFLTEGPEPVWKVLDFGAAALGSSGTLTQGKLLGTPGYMAPEQVRGEATDYRTDLYALGIIAYRAMTGRPAFDGKDVPAILYKAVFAMPYRPSEVDGVPRAVDAVLAVAIAKDAEDRFQSGEAFAEALAESAAGRVGAGILRRADALPLKWSVGLEAPTRTAIAVPIGVRRAS